MYVFSTSQNDIYQQGVDEGRRQVLADIAKIVHDAKESTTLDTTISIADSVCDYLEQEGIYEKA